MFPARNGMKFKVLKFSLRLNAHLIPKCESISDIPDSNKDVDKEKKVEDDEANQVEGMKSVELAELPRKQGNTEAEDDKARSYPSG